MVHGNWYSVQYEIRLNNSVDLYNVVLPICSHVRRMIRLVDGNILVLIDQQELSKRFYSIPMASDYIRAIDTLRYTVDENKFAPELVQYMDVKKYSEKFKFTDVLSTSHPLDPLILAEKKHRLQYLSHHYLAEVKDEYMELVNVVDVQSIISSPTYCQHIIDMERELTNIVLTQDEMDFIQSVESHPSLAGLIQFSGINLVSGWY